MEQKSQILSNWLLVFTALTVEVQVFFKILGFLYQIYLKLSQHKLNLIISNLYISEDIALTDRLCQMLDGNVMSQVDMIFYL